MFETAPTLTPFQALMAGGGIIAGGIVMLALTLWLARWLARR